MKMKKKKMKTSEASKHTTLLTIHDMQENDVNYVTSINLPESNNGSP